MYFELASNLLYSVHAGGEAILVIMDMLTQFLMLLERLRHLGFAEALVELFPGITAMMNIHPLLVHFPIVLIPLFFLLDLSGFVFKKLFWREAASLILSLALIFTVVTIVTGLLAAKTIPHAEDVHMLMESHKHLAILILMLMVILTIWRFSHSSPPVGVDGMTFMGLAGLTSLLIIFTADMGGLMVYGHGVAVAPVMHSAEVQQAAEQHEHEPGHVHSE